MKIGGFLFEHLGILLEAVCLWLDIINLILKFIVLCLYQLLQGFH